MKKGSVSPEPTADNASPPRINHARGGSSGRKRPESCLTPSCELRAQRTLGRCGQAGVAACAVWLWLVEVASSSGQGAQQGLAVVGADAARGQHRLVVVDGKATRRGSSHQHRLVVV